MRSHDANPIRRWILPAAALLALVAAWIFVAERFTLADVKLAARALDEIACAHPIALFFAAMATQAVGMAFSLPTKALLALLAGALLGPLAGAASVPNRASALGSLIGDLPVTALYAFAGSRLMSLASAGEAISPVTCVVLAAAGVAMFVAAVALPMRGRS